MRRRSEPNDVEPRDRAARRQLLSQHRRATAGHPVTKWSSFSPSPHFRQSKRYPVLLRYIVEKTLEGRATELKERTLGVEVFQRDADYDTSLDPVVRITAGEVRKRLAQYYHDSGHADEPRIDLPAGSYIPQFRSAAEERSQEFSGDSIPIAVSPTIAASEKTEVVSVPQPDRRRLGATASVALSVLLTVLATLAAWAWQVRQRGPIDAIWNPFFTSSALLISIGEPSVLADHNPDAKTEPLTVREHLRSVDYMVFSDVQALTRVTGLLDGHRHPYRLLPASATTYADLRQGPALLLGGFDNPWTMRATAALRFRFERQNGGDELWIEDRKDPLSRKWAVNFGQRYDSLVEDYAIVARFMDPNTHQPVLILAGIGENGTKAASEFMTDPSSEALRNLTGNKFPAATGKDWAGQNFELVLRTRVINGVSGPPILVAEEVW